MDYKDFRSNFSEMISITSERFDGSFSDDSCMIESMFSVSQSQNSFIRLKILERDLCMLFEN